MSSYERSLAKQLQYCFIISSQIHVKQSWSPDRWYSRGSERSNERVIDRVRRWRWSTTTWHSTAGGLSAQITWSNSAAPSISVILPSASACWTLTPLPCKLTRVEPVLCSEIWGAPGEIMFDAVNFETFNYWFLPCTSTVCLGRICIYI